MNKKATAIIQSALKLFAAKGFRATSIQEIVDDCHISKGAFYLHFNSKETLLVSIFQYYYDRKKQKFQEFDHIDLTPRNKCIQWIKIEFEEMYTHREFILMQMREQAIPLNTEIQQLLLKSKLETFNLIYTFLADIYDESIQIYLHDLSFILNGLIESYFPVIIFSKHLFDWSNLAEFLMNRIDEMATGLSSHTEKPQLSPERIEFFTTKLMNIESMQLITQIEAAIVHLNLTKETKASLEILISEIKKPEPRRVIIEGMLANIQKEKQLSSLQEQIKQYLKSLLIADN